MLQLLHKWLRPRLFCYEIQTKTLPSKQNITIYTTSTGYCPRFFQRGRTLGCELFCKSQSLWVLDTTQVIRLLNQYMDLFLSTNLQKHVRLFQKVDKFSRHTHWEGWWTMSPHPPQSSIHLVFSCNESRRVVLFHTQKYFFFAFISFA